MAIGEPILPVYCDSCGDIAQCSMTSLARGGCDDRGVKMELKSWGWIYISDDEIYCSEECQEEAQL